jgi:hypothetical protein
MLGGLLIAIFLIPIVVFPIMWVLGNFVVGWCAGIISWATIYFWTILPHFTFYTEANQANLLSDSFIPENANELKTFVGRQKFVALTEYEPGQHWKWPHEKVVRVVDMSREIIVTHEPEEVYTFAGGLDLIVIKYQVVVRPLPGNISNYIQTHPKAIRQQAKSRVTAFIQGYIGSRTKADFGKKGQEEFKKAFEKEFGKEHIIDDFERDLGIWMSTAIIIDIDDTPEVQKARNFAKSFNLIMDTARHQVEESKKVPGGTPLTQQEAVEAAYRILAAMGRANIDLVDIKTLGGRILPNLPLP